MTTGDAQKELLVKAYQEIDKLERVVIKCAQRFNEYAEHHNKNGALEKAQRNLDMAQMCMEALE